MKDDVLNKIKELNLKAQENGNRDVHIHLSSSNGTALSEAIKTQEQADLFMKMLKSL